MTSLLDVNVLIALLDPYHLFHHRAHVWFEQFGRRSWATCPLTENGAIRVFGHRRYLEGPGSPAEAARLVGGLRAATGHVFWPDSLSLFDEPSVKTRNILTSAAVTDTYLLALAVSQDGTLATFDRKLAVSAVRGGADALHVID